VLLESLFPVPRGTLEKLRQYEALLIKWQKAINLVGPATISDAWTRHFIDSIQLAPLVPEGSKTLYDLGSGAGFPGLVLAMVYPELAVTLIESDQKKCAFLTTVSRESETPVAVLAERIEKAVEILPAPDIVTARALAPLSELLNYIWPWVQANPNLTCIFPKGQLAKEELAVASQNWTFDSRETISITDENATILIIKNIDRIDKTQA
jgi:16S rRNA (guanine527-N7)-methyltransferase